MCSSQSFFRFSKARMDVGVMPATSSRNSHTGRLKGCTFACLFFCACSALGLRAIMRLLIAMNLNSFITQSKAVHARVMRHAAGLQEVERAHPFSLPL